MVPVTAARVTAQGPALSPDDVTDRLAAIAATYGADGDGRVVVADGFGCKVTVHHGALTIADGVGETRRERSYGKVGPPARVLVAGDGLLTTEALSWCRAQGVAVVVLRAGAVLLAASPPGRDDARLRRAQAVAGIDGSPVGLAVVRTLLAAKLAGQARNLSATFGAHETASTVLDLAGGIEIAETVDDARQLEAVAAAAYFGAWAGHPATALAFVARDRRRVPPHWCAYDSRRSAITGSANTNRLAERPLNALLNLCYRYAEIEARFALVRLGLDAGLGCLHLDAPGRDSLALDLIEPVRPAVDRFVLGMVAERTFRKADFVERSDGHVRVAAPLSHELAATMPTWRREVAPWAEAVAHAFADAVPGKTTKTTPLTNAKATAAQAEVKRRKAEDARARAETARERAEAAAGLRRAALPVRRPRAVAPEQAAAAMARCLDCGAQLSRPRHVRCPGCWERQGGAVSRDARRRRGRSIAAARNELDAWRAEHPHATARPDDFAPILSALRSVTLARIMAATGVSKTTASGWRTGRHVPPLARWCALAALVGVPLPAGVTDAETVAPVVSMEAEVHYREKARDDYEHEVMAAEDAGQSAPDVPAAVVARMVAP